MLVSCSSSIDIEKDGFSFTNNLIPSLEYSDLIIVMLSLSNSVVIVLFLFISDKLNFNFDG